METYCRDCKYKLSHKEQITNKCPKCGSIYLIPEELTKSSIKNRKRLLKKENESFGSRIASTFAMMLASFLTSLIIWLLISIFVVRGSELFILPIPFIIYFTFFFTVLGFIFPNKTLEVISWIWKKIDNFIKALNDYNGPM